jgi:ribosomal 30S subunit maturation factor RimM
MKLFFDKQNKFRQANTWIDTYRLREAKKQGSEAITGTQEYSTENQIESLYQPQVVFTQADQGHSQEETQKIQELYVELGKLPLSPVFAI